MAETNPSDLQIVSQPNTNKDYFNFKAIGLKVNETYSIKFQWVNSDGSVSNWSPGYFLQTSNETAPAVPSSTTVPSTGTGSIPVTLTTYPTNAKRVDVYVTGGIFGLGKVAYSFTTAGTTTIAAPAGTYIVQLRSVSPTGVTSTVGTTHEITISDVGETIQSPTNPNGFSSRRILAGIEVSWAGTYANSTFTGFEGINIYAGTSATATAGTYTQVGVLSANNVKNTIVVPVDGTYVAYGQAVYIHAASVNKNGTVGTIQANVTNQTLGPGKATDADINDGAVVISKLASDVLTVGNLKAGDINATSYIRAGTASSARVELASSTVGSVLPGFYIYNSAGTAVLSAPLSGGLSIVGSGTFTGSITGASGQFDGDLGASGGNFTVRSGTLTALAGNIGGWIINESALKSSAVAFPSIELDPVESKIHLRGTAGSSEIGSYIKMDTTNGIRIGSGASPRFTVDMSGVLSAQDATISGTITSSSINSSSITGSSIQTSSDTNFGSVRLSSPGGTIEMMNQSNSVYGQMYLYNSGNELILRHGSNRTFDNSFLGYPTGSAMLSLNPYTTTLQYTDVNGYGTYGLDITSDGSNRFTGDLQSYPTNGGANTVGNTLRYVRNTVINNTTPSGSGFYIGDIWIQY